MITHSMPYIDTNDLNLDWLLKNMKQIIQQWADYQVEMNQNFSDLNAAFEALQAWINSYFDNLDVQQEINVKLNAMARSGELLEIIQPTISSNVSEWLAEHITQPTTPAIDTSLTVSGAGADSKTVGDNFDITLMARTSINADTDLDTVKKIGNYLLFTGHTYAHAPEWYRSGVAWLIVLGNAAGGQLYQIFMKRDTKEIAIRTASTPTGGVLTFSDWITLYHSKVDNTLSIAGDAADAKTVGDLLALTYNVNTSISSDTDINSLMDKGSYLLFTGYTYSHAPTWYAGGVAWLYVLSNTTSTYEMQLFLDRDTKRVAIRSYSSNAFSDWVTLPLSDDLLQCFTSFANITVDTDIDTLTGYGSYLLYSGHTYTHCPAWYTSGVAWLLNYRNPSNLHGFQVFIKRDTKEIAIRTYSTPTGGILTFTDWVNLHTNKKLIGKKVSIIGDSISTFQGYIPQGYAYYYPHGDLNTIGETWFRQFTNITGATLLVNASWSGSSVADDDDTPLNTAKIAYSDARINDLKSGTTTPDIVIVLIGTNDFARGYSIGTFTQTTEISDGTTSIRDFKPAYACMINKIKVTYPNAHVYCCTLIQRYRGDDETYPIINGSGTALSEYNQAITDIATWLGCEIIRLDTAISLGQLEDLTVDGSLHPNAAGAKIIANRIIADVLAREAEYL